MIADRLRRGYVAAALIAFNAAVLFAAINLVAGATFGLKDRFRPGNPANAHAQTYGISVDALRTVYPGLSVTEIGEIFREVWIDNALDYEPFTLFRERPRQGKHLNVRPEGFRTSHAQGAWPPDHARFRTVFVFGGSTTFGYGVQDDETVVSHLQRLSGDEPAGARPARFYNFGRGYYYLSQERILFQQLLAAGVVPDAAVFIDGLNDLEFTTEPAGSARFRQGMDTRSFRENLARTLQTLPVTKATRRIMAKLSGGQESEPETRPAATAATDAGRDRLIQSVIARYLEDKKLIEAMAAAHAIRVFFVWQPVPTFRYDLRYHLFARHGAIEGLELVTAGYAAMERVRPATSDFIWCADIQNGVAEPLYVDPVHYSGAMNGRLARCIAAGMKE